jgi:hypothetical protein
MNTDRRPSQHGTQPTLHLHHWDRFDAVTDDGWPKPRLLHPVGRTVALECWCGEKRIIHSEITPGVS